MKPASVTRKAERLRTRLRGRSPDAIIEVTPADISLLDRGLCALIDGYAKGQPVRDIWPKNLKTRKSARVTHET